MDKDLQAPIQATKKLSRSVLVLNQTYYPISVTTVKKAIILLFLEKAELIKSNVNEFIRSNSVQFPQPSIIRLMNYRNFPKSIDLTRRNIHKRDNMRCQYCGKSNVQLTIDHIIPRSRGGKDEWENLVTACISCNNKKGNRTPEEAGMKLISKPKKPSPLFFIRQNFQHNENDWKDYLFY